jgi:hypothetical protein
VKPFILSYIFLTHETNEVPALFSFLRAKTMAYQQYFEHNTHTFQSEKRVTGRCVFRPSNFAADRSH